MTRTEKGMRLGHCHVCKDGLDDRNTAIVLALNCPSRSTIIVMNGSYYTVDPEKKLKFLVGHGGTRVHRALNYCSSRSAEWCSNISHPGSYYPSIPTKGPFVSRRNASWRLTD